ncbi:hypothetical protein H8959_004562 [Pygathrix nigripes]
MKIALSGGRRARSFRRDPGTTTLSVQKDVSVEKDQVMDFQTGVSEVGSSRRLRDCGVCRGLGSRPAPGLGPPPLTGSAQPPLRSWWGARRGRAWKGPWAPSPPPARTPPARSSRPARGDCSRAIPARLLHHMSRYLPPRARAAGQRLVDYSRRPDRPPPAARHPSGTGPLDLIVLQNEGEVVPSECSIGGFPRLEERLKESSALYVTFLIHITTFRVFVGNEEMLLVQRNRACKSERTVEAFNTGFTEKENAPASAQGGSVPVSSACLGVCSSSQQRNGEASPDQDP